MWTQWRQVFYQNQRSKSCWRSCMRRMILRSNSEEEMKKWRKSSTDVKNIDLHTTHQNVIFIDFYTLHFTFIYHWFILLKFQTMFMLWMMKYKNNPSVEFDELEPRQSWLTHWLPFLRSILIAWNTKLWLVDCMKYSVLIGWLYEILSCDWLIAWNTQIWLVDCLKYILSSDWLIVWNTQFWLVDCMKYSVLIG